MSTKYSIEVTKEELDVFGALIDTAVRYRGLEIIKHASLALKRIEEATPIEHKNNEEIE